MSKTYIVDGNSLLFRSFYATFRPDQPVMTAKDGTPTNAIFAFIPMIQTIHNRLGKDDRMIVCFDTGKPSFRSSEIEGYKAQRKPIDPSLKSQIPLAHELLKHMGIDTAEKEGYEGDDVAGSLAKYAEKQGDDVVLLTSDKDFLQLIDDKIQVLCLRKGLTDTVTYTNSNVKELYGVRADQVVDYKAIAGDSSDNYKGIPHIGEKTAKSLLDKYDHLEDILEAYKDKSDTALARHINEGAEEGKLCKVIATIVTDLDVRDFYDRAQVREPDTQELLSFYEKLDLYKYAKPLRAKLAAQQKEPESARVSEAQEGAESAEDVVSDESPLTADIPAQIEYETVDDIPDSDRPTAFSAILSKENENIADILGFAVGYPGGKVLVISSENLQSAKNFIKFLEDADYKKDCLDIKASVVAGRRLGFEPRGFDYDFILASYILDSDSASTLDAAFSQLGVTLPEDSIQRYALATSIMEKHKAEMLERIKDYDSEKLLSQVEIPLAYSLADMEYEGLPLDLGELSRIGEDYRKLLDSLESQIYELAGSEFNIKSPAQVSDILFNKLGIKKGKKESGTSVEVLTNHLLDHPIIPLILQHRTYSKIVSGYIDALPKHVLRDGKIHARINQTLTSTGRLSCSEPNLQNISIRKEEGKEVRKAFFYPEEDYEFLSLDYSQVELRVLASLGNIENLIQVCNSGEDIHAATAAMVFGVPIEKVTSEMRRQAKTVNFGIVYGISTFGLKERLGISFKEAQDIIEAFKRTFDGIDQYEKGVIDFARANGYVKTILNRRRYFPDINSSDPRRRKFSERAAVNATIQGSAADLIKVAMNRVADILKGRKTRMVIQIHDELVFKVYKPEERELIPLISKAMDEALPLKVKLSVEGTTGHSWFDCK